MTCPLRTPVYPTERCLLGLVLDWPYKNTGNSWTVKRGPSNVTKDLSSTSQVEVTKALSAMSLGIREWCCKQKKKKKKKKKMGSKR